MTSLNNTDLVNLTCLCSTRSIEEQGMFCRRAAAEGGTEMGLKDLSHNQKNSRYHSC